MIGCVFYLLFTNAILLLVCIIYIAPIFFFKLQCDIFHLYISIALDLNTILHKYIYIYKRKL